MSTVEAIERAERIKHETCDKWGHPKPYKLTPEQQKEHRTMTELAVWLVLGLCALWLLVQFGLAKG